MEFIVKGPPVGESGLLVTNNVDTGPGGENDPNRMLAIITALKDAAEPSSRNRPLSRTARDFTNAVAGKRRSGTDAEALLLRKPLEPNNPNSATEFYLTVDGQTPAPFDPKSALPNIAVKQGT